MPDLIPTCPTILGIGSLVAALLVERHKAAAGFQVRLPLLDELRGLVRFEIVIGNRVLVFCGVVHNQEH